MAASAPETTVPGRLTTLLLGVILLGAVLLIVAEFLPLYEIRVVTAVPKGGHTQTGGHHGYALLVIGLALIPMAWGALRGGSRPAAIACAGAVGDRAVRRAGHRPARISTRPG